MTLGLLAINIAVGVVVLGFLAKFVGYKFAEGFFEYAAEWKAEHEDGVEIIQGFAKDTQSDEDENEPHS